MGAVAMGAVAMAMVALATVAVTMVAVVGSEMGMAPAGCRGLHNQGSSNGIPLGSTCTGSASRHRSYHY